MSELAAQYFGDRASSEALELPSILTGVRLALHPVPLHIPTDVVRYSDEVRGIDRILDTELLSVAEGMTARFAQISTFMYSSLRNSYPTVKYGCNETAQTISTRARKISRALLPKYEISGYMDDFSIEVIHPDELAGPVRRQLEKNQGQAADTELFYSTVAFLLRANLFTSAQPDIITAAGRFVIRGVHDTGGHLRQLHTRPSIVTKMLRESRSKLWNAAT